MVALMSMRHLSDGSPTQSIRVYFASSENILKGRRTRLLILYLGPTSLEFDFPWTHAAQACFLLMLLST